jgi:hypothetical protein
LPNYLINAWRQVIIIVKGWYHCNKYVVNVVDNSIKY